MIGDPDLLGRMARRRHRRRVIMRHVERPQRAPAPALPQVGDRVRTADGFEGWVDQIEMRDPPRAVVLGENGYRRCKARKLTIVEAA